VKRKTDIIFALLYYTHFAGKENKKEENQREEESGAAMELRKIESKNGGMNVG
jgi:hypothetical protein